jgi:hypothetical protein
MKKPSPLPRTLEGTRVYKQFLYTPRGATLLVFHLCVRITCTAIPLPYRIVAKMEDLFLVICCAGTAHLSYLLSAITPTGLYL